MARYIPRKREERETKLVAEFLAKHYPDRSWDTSVRLGRVEPRLAQAKYEPEELAMLQVTLRWADAVVFPPPNVIIIEGAIRGLPQKISQLELYARLARVTPRITRYGDFPVELMLVYAIEDPITVTMAREKGIRCVYFRPRWVNKYLAELTHRERRAPRSGL